MLKGVNISLRAVEPFDIDWLYQWENNPLVWNVSNTLAPFSKHVLQQYINTAHQDIYTTKQLRLMITLHEEVGERTIGTIDLFDFDPVHSRAGVGVLIAAPDDRKKGYASEALKLLIQYSFEILGLHQLYCNIGVDNNASVLLFKHHGFEITGVKKHWIKEGAAFRDEYFLQLMNPAH